MVMPDCCRKYYKNKILGDGQDLSRNLLQNSSNLRRISVGLFVFWLSSDWRLIFLTIIIIDCY